MSAFAHLKPKTPIGDVVSDYVVWDLEDEPVLRVRTSADPNRKYVNAMMARANQNRRRIKGNQRDDVVALSKLQDELDIELFPKHVVVGWDKMNDPDGNPIEFNETNCREFLCILKELGLFNGLRQFCGDVTNFSDVFSNPEEAAGNLPPDSPGS